MADIEYVLLLLLEKCIFAIDFICRLFCKIRGEKVALFSTVSCFGCQQ